MKRNSEEAIGSNQPVKKKGNPATGRKRDPTFTASEKLALIELVENHFDVVECKRTDAINMRQKNDEWRKIETEFNATSSVYQRDWSVLKNCWENLKKRAKQELTQRNQDVIGTGGGPPKKRNEDPFIERVLDLLQPRISGYVNPYDCDSGSIASSSQRSIAASSEMVGPSQPIAGPSHQKESTVFIRASSSQRSIAASSEMVGPSQPIAGPSHQKESTVFIRASSSQRSIAASSEMVGPSQPIAGPSHQKESTVFIRDAGEINTLIAQDTETATTETFDWSQYTPSMLRDPINPNLMQPSPCHVDEHEQQLQFPTEMQASTPRVQHRAPPSMSRRRPTLSTSRRRPNLRRDRGSEALSTLRISTLELANSQAEEEHNIRINILRLQEEQEKEKLKQEALKTKQEEIKLEMLDIGLQKLKE